MRNRGTRTTLVLVIYGVVIAVLGWIVIKDHRNDSPPSNQEQFWRHERDSLAARNLTILTDSVRFYHQMDEDARKRLELNLRDILKKREANKNATPRERDSLVDPLVDKYKDL